MEMTATGLAVARPCRARRVPRPQSGHGLAVRREPKMAMLAVIGAVSLIVYDQGLAFLRRGWINLDVLWSVALAVGGISLLAG